MKKTNINMKQHLPIDLVSVNCLTPEESIKALAYCNKFFTFNRTILFTSESISKSNCEIVKINKFKTIDDYSDFMLKIGNFTTSDHVLIIQDDGHIINSERWDNKFLEYDYIGAPWPKDYRWRKRWNKKIYNNASKNAKKNRVGNGGFSLRSRKFLDYSMQFGSCKGIAEDVFLCLVNYEIAMENDIKFAPFDLAYYFSAEVPLIGKKLTQEGKNLPIDVTKHFGWHGKRFTNSEILLDLKNSTGEL